MKTFFNPRQNVSTNDSFSPSAGKPQKFLDYLKKKNFLVEIKEDFSPVTREDLYLAHDKKMVDDILDLKKSNGFGNRLPELAKSLPFTTGSFTAAAIEAMKTHQNTFSPTSGFHHACFDTCGGYCTFNGLVVAAQVLKREGLVKKVGIVDCDAHYGNGTVDIIRRLNLDWIKHYTFGADNLRSEKEWIERLPGILDDFSDVDIILYQAGGDPHINDPLGGYLTTEVMAQRDEIVFKKFYEADIPVAWNLAGGYQNPLERVLELHLNTFEIAEKYSAQKEKDISEYKKKLEQIQEKFDQEAMMNDLNLIRD